MSCWNCCDVLVSIVVTIFRINEVVGRYVGLTVEVRVGMVFSNGKEPCG